MEQTHIQQSGADIGQHHQTPEGEVIVDGVAHSETELHPELVMILHRLQGLFDGLNMRQRRRAAKAAWFDPETGELRHRALTWVPPEQ